MSLMYLLVFSTTGGMAPEASEFLKIILQNVMTFIKHQLQFSLHYFNKSKCLLGKGPNCSTIHNIKSFIKLLRYRIQGS